MVEVITFEGSLLKGTTNKLRKLTFKFDLCANLKLEGSLFWELHCGVDYAHGSIRSKLFIAHGSDPGCSDLTCTVLHTL